MEARILVGNDGKDLLTIFHEPLIEGKPVTGIARTIIVAEGARPPRSAVAALLSEKYGALKQIGEYAFLGIHEPPVREPSQPSGERSISEIVERSTRQQHAKTTSCRCRKVLESLAMAAAYKVSAVIGRDGSAFPLKLSLVDEAGDVVTAPSVKAANPLWPVIRTIRADQTCGADVVLAVVEADGQGQRLAHPGLQPVLSGRGRNLGKGSACPGRGLGHPARPGAGY